MSAPPPAFRRLFMPVITVTCMAAVIIVLLALIIAGGGHDVPRALGAMGHGAAGSWYAFTSATLVRATPLMLAGLGVALAFRAGVFNIGAEGQLIVGAAAAAAVGLGGAESLGRMVLPLSLMAAAAAGAAWALVPAWLRRRFGVREVITTIMLNFVGVHLVSYLVRGPLQEPTRIYPQSATLDAIARLPLLMSNTRLHLGFVLAVVTAIAVWGALRYTAAGFRVRASGASATAARSAGRIDVDATVSRVFLVSAALAGLAGGVEATGVTYALYENLSPGYGYTAIAVALLAGLHPLGIVGSAILFGALEAGAAAMQRDAGVPSVLVSVVEAMIILALLGGRALQGRLREASRGRSAAGTSLPERADDATAGAT